MKNIIDMHCHIIPEVDDGAETFDLACRMLCAEAEDGVGTVILTPHYRKDMFETDTATVIEKAVELKNRIDTMGLEIELCLGREYHANAEMIEELKQNECYRLNGGRFVLVEFSSTHSFHKVRNWIYQLIVAGFRPIIAHVERYGAIVDKLSNLEELLELGALMQVSSGAVLGEHGLRLKMLTGKLLKKGWVHFIGTDAHDLEERKPNLGECAEYVSKKYGKDYAEQIFIRNPQKILETPVEF